MGKDKLATIINDSLNNNTYDLILEKYEKRSDWVKSKHLEILKYLDCSFINFKMIPINQDTLDRTDITMFCKLHNKDDHMFVKNEIIKILESV